MRVPPASPPRYGSRPRTAQTSLTYLRQRARLVQRGSAVKPAGNQESGGIHNVPFAQVRTINTRGISGQAGYINGCAPQERRTRPEGPKEARRPAFAGPQHE